MLGRGNLYDQNCTVSPRCLGPFNTVAHYTKWAKASWYIVASRYLKKKIISEIHSKQILVLKFLILIAGLAQHSCLL